jgi:DNA polymerase-3 subunit gamma/tau
MSYLVLARKYRPRNFAELVGQEHVVQALSNALTTQRLHHAYLFTGTRGVGKTTVSRILAKSLNCQGVDGQGGITATPCGVCQACLDIDSGRFVDYTELDAASNRGVDEVQALLEQAVYKPVQGRFKVFMIDEVHMLTNTAFNAMLKTLEEPPAYLKFVLATTDPQKVPVTVLSRCLQFNLRPMAPDTVQTHLTQVLASEAVHAEPAALRLLSRAARGSMRDALSLADQAIAFGNGQLQEVSVQQMLGSVDRTYVFQLIAALAQADGKTVVEVVDTLRTNGLSAATTLEEMAMVLQRMAVYQAVAQMAAAVDAGDPEAVETARLAQTLPADETQLLYSLCLHGRGELGLAPDEYAALTMVLLRLLAFKPGNMNAGAADAPTAPVQPTDRTAPTDPSAEKKTLKSDDAPAASVAPAQLLPPVLPQPSPPQPLSPPTLPPPSVSAVVVTTQPSPWEPGALPAPQPTYSAHSANIVTTAVSDSDLDAAAPVLVQSTGVEMEVVASVPVEGVFSGKKSGLTIEYIESVASKLVAMRVRQTPEPSARLQPHAAVPDAALGTSARTQAHVVPTPEGDVWYGVVQQLVAAEAVTALARELALQSQLIARDGGDAGHWVLRVERESLNQPNTRERLRAALEAAGHASHLNIEIGIVTDSPARRNAQTAQERQRIAEAVVHNDPYVQVLMRDFGAKIVPGSIQPVVLSAPKAPEAESSQEGP